MAHGLEGMLIMSLSKTITMHCDADIRILGILPRASRRSGWRVMEELLCIGWRS